ncbi:MAG: hypothetical protein MI861_21855 [Pirellulales bacterium]|nr:hypothetical protein [Pirellulales bacterium]
MTTVGGVSSGGIFFKKPPGHKTKNRHQPKTHSLVEETLNAFSDAANERFNHRPSQDGDSLVKRSGW